MVLLSNEREVEVKDREKCKSVNLENFKQYLLEEGEDVEIPEWISNFDIDTEILHVKTAEELKALGHEDLDDDFINEIADRNFLFENEIPAVLFLFHEMKYIFDFEFNNKKYHIYLDMIAGAESKDSSNKQEIEVYNDYQNLTDEEKESIKNEMKSKLSNDLGKLRLCLRMYHRNKDISDEVLEQYVDMWAEAKLGLYLMLGRNIIVNKEYTCEADREEIKNLYNNFKGGLYDSTCLKCIEVDDIIKNTINTRTFFSRILSNYDIRWDNETGLPTKDNIKEFVKKRKISPYIFKALDVYESMKGDSCKVSKVIDKMFESDIISQRFSEVTQGKKQKHNIHISIHPVDFLTMSMTSTWTSCSRPGSVGGGAGISYGLDGTTLIAYSAKNFNTDMFGFQSVPGISIYHDLKWNDKRWRMLIYANPKNGTATFYREYPGKICDLRYKLREFYEEIVSNNFGVENKWNINHSCYGHIEDVRNDSGNTNHYNDILNFNARTEHDKEYSLIWLNNTNYMETMYVGSPGICLECGKPIYNKEYCLCRECLSNY